MTRAGLLVAMLSLGGCYVSHAAQAPAPDGGSGLALEDASPAADAAHPADAEPCTLRYICFCTEKYGCARYGGSPCEPGDYIAGSHDPCDS